VLEFIAQGPQARQRWKTRLERRATYRLGRTDAADLPVPWENWLSAVHATLTVSGDALLVERCDSAANPIFFEGVEQDRFELQPGEQFVIGQTAFRLLAANDDSTPEAGDPLEEITFTRQQLQQVRFGDADRRIDVLSRLPDVIGGAREPDDRDARLVGLVLSGIRKADVVAIVEAEDGEARPRVRYWERRQETAGAFRPSRRLVQESLRRGGGSVLHVWTSREVQEPSYTESSGVDWAFCTPVAGRGAARWGLYVTGSMPAGQQAAADSPFGAQLHADVKFTELVADILSSVLRMGRLEGNLAVLRQFLAPPIVAALERSSQDGSLDAELLEPRECSVTVLFCDLRGFSQRAEGSAHDLGGLLRRVSGALQIMTHQITGFGGVTGDFLGDATLGFWGWPFASEEAPLNACRAALAIRQEFAALQSNPNHPLSDFEVGIGVAHGRAVAGKIGTEDRVTVTVFGPVVNLASRLEGLTRQLHVPILLDEATAALVRGRLCDREGRVRRLARIQPYGMEIPLTVSELLPPEEAFPDLTNEHLRLYEEGVDNFIAGRWEQAWRCLHAMPPSDRAQDFLTLRIAQNNRTAPPDWDGVIRMPSK
jgi:adenylate cyclase